jgi:integrase
VLYGLFATLSYTGLRRGEAMGLRWSEVDLDRRLITVRRSYEGRTKSGKDRLMQRILGHSTPQITSDTYAHLSPAHLAGAADRVSFPIPAAPAKVIPFQAAVEITATNG